VQIGILEGDNFSSRALERLGTLGAVEVFAGGEVGDFLHDKEVVFIRLGRYIGSEELNLAPRLRYLCSPTTGHNHIDLNAMEKRGVELVSLRGEQSFLAGIRATPEHTFGLMLSLLRNYHEAFLRKGHEVWDRDRYRGYELFGNSVGIIGLGRVGRIVADYCRAFGARVLYYDPCQEVAANEFNRMESIKELIDASRIIVLSASYEPKKGAIIDRALISRMEGRYFVNTARGELVDEPAMLAAIGSDFFAGVATDVVADENKNNRLREWIEVAEGRNVIITPHIAGATFTSMQNTEEFIVDKLLSLVG
jgi:D-3-phosphoglycerate dehydrogenase